MTRPSSYRRAASTVGGIDRRGKVVFFGQRFRRRAAGGFSGMWVDSDASYPVVTSSAGGPRATLSCAWIAGGSGGFARHHGGHRPGQAMASSISTHITSDGTRQQQL